MILKFLVPIAVTLSACGQPQTRSHVRSLIDAHDAEDRIFHCSDTAEHPTSLSRMVLPMTIELKSSSQQAQVMSPLGYLPATYDEGKYEGQTRLSGFFWFAITVSTRTIASDIQLSFDGAKNAFGYADVWMGGTTEGPQEETLFLDCRSEEEPWGSINIDALAPEH